MKLIGLILSSLSTAFAVSSVISQVDIHFNPHNPNNTCYGPGECFGAGAQNVANWFFLYLPICWILTTIIFVILQRKMPTITSRLYIIGVMSFLAITIWLFVPIILP